MSWLVTTDAALTYQLQQAFLSLPLSDVPSLAATCSSLGDPRYLYLVLFPFVFWLVGPRAGAHTLAITALGEWLNITLKWILRGDRPFWWVKEREDWPQDQVLLQVPVTCETGPGNPSGHVMITLAALLTAAYFIDLPCPKTSEQNQNSTKSKPNSWHSLLLISTVMRGSIATLTVITGVSRVLVSSHFIHQVLLAILIGDGLLYHVVTKTRFFQSRMTVATQNAGALTLTAILLFVVAVSIYYVWSWMGLDPDFSVEKAMAHCQNPSWVHLDTTPFFSLARSCGSFLGLAVASRFLSHPWSKRTHSLVQRLVGLALSFAALAVVHALLSLHSGGNMVFYAVSLVKCSLVPVTVALCKLYMYT